MANNINNDPKILEPTDVRYPDVATKNQNKSNTVKKIDVKKINTDSQRPAK